MHHKNQHSYPLTTSLTPSLSHSPFRTCPQLPINPHARKSTRQKNHVRKHNSHPAQPPSTVLIFPRHVTVPSNNRLKLPFSLSLEIFFLLSPILIGYRESREGEGGRERERERERDWITERRCDSVFLSAHFLGRVILSWKISVLGRMEEMLSDLMEFFVKPSITETFVDILLCAVPIWLAVMIGLVIGWSWRPRWTGLLYLGLRSKFRFLWTAPPGFGARRLWLAFTALSAFSLCRTIWSNFKGKGKVAPPSAGDSAASGSAATAESDTDIVGPIAKGAERLQDVVTETDLEHLVNLIGGRDGEMQWQSLMERSTPSMAYKAWRHDPETGPTVYCSRTVFEDATPELVRDFFWDDEFRPKWDPMLTYFKILEECPQTGTMIVHWIKKFPFFCSDREYLIGRRIWEAGKTYYCVTKGVPYPGLPKRDKPRRVEHYFSSWIIKAVESRKGDGQLPACEVTLAHYEDMGIPKDVAKLGVRHGMWCTVKKLHSGMRAYQNARKSEAALSQSAQMAKITTKVSSNGSMNHLEPSPGEEEKGQIPNNKRPNENGIDWKWIVIGGSVALVCGLHTGVIGKGLLLGAGQRFARKR